MLKNYSRPVVRPLPQREEDVISLNGDWKFYRNPADGAELFSDYSHWDDIVIPADVSMTYERKDVGELYKFAYVKRIKIPSHFTDRIFLRFEGVNTDARVYVNGTFVMRHEGAFICWDCDISQYVNPDEDATIFVLVDDGENSLNPYNKGGIVRDVYMYCLPKIALDRLHGVTTFDSDYNDAVLRVMLRTSGSGNSDVRLVLTDKTGDEVISLTENVPVGCDVDVDISVSHPHKWDAEHPYLYTLTAEVIKDGEVVEVTSRRIGFRQIQRSGNVVRVNGDIIKLRGVNRHDTHPIRGRAINKEIAKQDLLLFKQANVNYIRTSHYPPTQAFLDYCDEYGLYIEDEMAMAFMGQTFPYKQNDAKLEKHFVDAIAETVERDMSHPCVIIWSLANEAFWGSNFNAAHKYVRGADPSRLTKFSYPITLKEEDDMVDVWSSHYVRWDAETDRLEDRFLSGEVYGGRDYPVVHDEYCHVPCYNLNTMSRDQGVREFWGHSIEKFWDNIYNTEGALGGAIWAGIDDVIFNKEELYMSYEWGLMDCWRRIKPEHFLVKKAYSPVKLGEAYTRDNTTVLNVTNRYNHICFDELTIKWTIGEETGTVDSDLKPGESGEFILPFIGDEFVISFMESSGFVSEESQVTMNAEKHMLPKFNGRAPGVEETEDIIRVFGDSFSMEFSKETAQLCGGYANNKKIITAGPNLKLTGITLPKWGNGAISYIEGDTSTVVKISGDYGSKLSVEFTITIDSDGLFETGYVITKMEYRSPRMVPDRIFLLPGGFHEVGVYYTLCAAVDTLDFVRDSRYSLYPEGHIGRDKGRAQRFSDGGKQRSGQQPEWDWQLDMRNPPLMGRYDSGVKQTRDFGSMRFDFLKASASCDGAAVEVYSNGSESMRLEALFKEENIIDADSELIHYAGEWIDFEEIHGSRNAFEKHSQQAGAYAELEFDGTGIVMIAPRDMTGGFVNIYLDGEFKTTISQLAKLNSSTSRGYEKQYDLPLYMIEDLPPGKHTLKVEVVGKPASGWRQGQSSAAYAFINYFVVLNEDNAGEVLMIIDNEYNYPDMSWGCYTKDAIIVEKGYSGKVLCRMLER